MSTESLIKYFILRNPKKFQIYIFRFGCAYKRIIMGLNAING